MIRNLQSMEIQPQKTPVVIQKGNLDSDSLQGTTLLYTNAILNNDGHVTNRTGFIVKKKIDKEVFWRNYPDFITASRCWETTIQGEYLIYFFLYDGLQINPFNIQIDEDNNPYIDISGNAEWEKYAIRTPTLKISYYESENEVDNLQTIILNKDQGDFIIRDKKIVFEGDVFDFEEGQEITVQVEKGNLGYWTEDNMVVKQVRGFSFLPYYLFQYGENILGKFYLCTGVSPVTSIIKKNGVWQSEEKKEQNLIRCYTTRFWDITGGKRGKGGFTQGTLSAEECLPYFFTGNRDNFVPVIDTTEQKVKDEKNKYAGKVCLEYAPEPDSPAVVEGQEITIKKGDTGGEETYKVLRATYETQSYMLVPQPAWEETIDYWDVPEANNIMHEFTYNHEHPDSPPLWVNSETWVNLQNDKTAASFQTNKRNFVTSVKITARENKEQAWRQAHPDQEYTLEQAQLDNEAVDNEYEFLNHLFLNPTYDTNGVLTKVTAISPVLMNKEFEPALNNAPNPVLAKLKLFYEITDEQVRNIKKTPNLQKTLKFKYYEDLPVSNGPLEFNFDLQKEGIDIELEIDDDALDCYLYNAYVEASQRPITVQVPNKVKKRFAANEWVLPGDGRTHAKLILDVTAEVFFRNKTNVKKDNELNYRVCLLSEYKIYLKTKTPNLGAIHQMQGFWYGIGVADITEYNTQETQKDQVLLYRTTIPGDPTKWYDVARDTFFFQNLSDFFPQTDKIISVISNQDLLYIIGTRFTQVWRPTNLPYKGLLKEGDKEQIQKEKIDIFGKYITTIECGCFTPDNVFIFENCVAVLNPEGLFIFNPFTLNGVPELKKITFNNEVLTHHALKASYEQLTKGQVHYFLNEIFLQSYKGGDILHLQTENNNVKFCSIFKSIYLNNQMPIKSLQSNYYVLAECNGQMMLISYHPSSQQYYDGDNIPIILGWNFGCNFPNNRVWCNMHIDVGVETENPKPLEGKIRIKSFAEPKLNFIHNLSFDLQKDYLKGRGPDIIFDKWYKKDTIPARFYCDSINLMLDLECCGKTQINQVKFYGILTNANKQNK